MSNKSLEFKTVKPILRTVLEQLMAINEFVPFRLVGGTSLSLRYGHRMSDDIDLFTDAEYGTLDFIHLQEILRREFGYCQGECGENVCFGTSYIVGNSAAECVKLDLFYSDAFITAEENYGNIRLAGVEDIIAMKMDVLSRGGRKKDFWDLHQLASDFSLKEMLDFYERRYPYGASREECITGFTNFSVADLDPDPMCLKGKIWQLIKLDFFNWIDSEDLGL